MTPTATRRILLAPFVLLGGLTACDRSPTGPTPGGLRIAEMVIVDSVAGQAARTVYSHEDHWHGVFRLQPEETHLMQLHVVTKEQAAANHDLPPRSQWVTLADHPDHRVRVTIEDPSIATWTGNATTATLVGHRVGATHLTFVVLRGETTVYQSAPVGVSVVE